MLFLSEATAVHARYPEDFVGDAETDPGEYRYAWTVTEVQGTLCLPAGQVASGRFELTRAAGA